MMNNERSRQDLHNNLLRTALQSQCVCQKFVKNVKFVYKIFFKFRIFIRGRRIELVRLLPAGDLLEHVNDAHRAVEVEADQAHLGDLGSRRAGKLYKARSRGWLAGWLVNRTIFKN